MEHSFSSRIRWPVPVLAFLLVLPSCANWEKKEGKPPESDLSELYLDGKAKLLGEMLVDVASAADAENLGDRAFQQENFDRAILYYVRAYSLDPGNIGVLEKLGYLYERRGDRKLADLAYKTILQKNPHHAVANEQLGLISLHARRYEEAKRYFREALAADPKRPASLNGLGVLADLAGDHYEAAAHYQKALALNPQSVSILNNLAYSSYLAGDLAGARRYLKESLALDPNYRRGLENFALIEAREGRYETAYYYFARLMPSAAAYNNVGYICMMNQDHACAEKYFRKAIEASDSYYAKAEENLEALRALRRGGEEGTASPPAAAELEGQARGGLDTFAGRELGPNFTRTVGPAGASPGEGASAGEGR
ncbi:MAG TPA: tetratricopeptide repeat protein [Methylococcus sp.]|nr:tetratricopeptide repeat protein [Methylococcus sp.]